MNKLTELERELLNSVQALQTGLKQEVAQSRNSLSAYDQAMSGRLSNIEKKLDDLDERLNRAFKRLTEVSDALELHLPEFEKSTKDFERSMKDSAATVRRYAK